jgi:hypothetical protein
MPASRAPADLRKHGQASTRDGVEKPPERLVVSI